MPPAQADGCFYKAVLFDLDGTLLDTLNDLAASGNQVLTEMGFPGRRVSDYRYLAGRGLRQLAHDMLPEKARAPALVNQAYDLLTVEYRKRQFDRTQPYPGIEKLLLILKAAGFKLTVLSNKTEEFTQALVNRFWPPHIFDLVWGSRPERPLKPDPAGAKAQAESLKIPVANFLYLGDTRVDMLTANAAGMAAIGVTWGFRDSRELREAGAQRLIDQPEQLLDLFQAASAMG